MPPTWLRLHITAYHFAVPGSPRVRDPSLECFYAAMRPVPSLHIIGDKDPVKRLTNQLIDSFDHPLVINHTRGHVIPALQPPDLQRVRAFLETQLREAAL